jgi:hypothetical protein
VTWNIKRSGKPKVNIMLVEYDDELVLNEDKLAQLYGKINDISSGNSSFGWLMYDNTVLVAKYEVAEEKDLELKITISKGAKYTMNSMWINSERQVLFLMAIYPMLIYIVSLTFQSVMNVTVNNQCSNIELVSPVHFIKNAIYHVQFPQRVEPNRIMRANIMIGIDRDMFGGALLYHLRRKVNASISTQLLVIWGLRHDSIYSHVWLIEHESTLFWDKDKLRRLYDVYNSQYGAYSTIYRGKWLLDDDTKLETKYVSSHRDFEIIISKSERILYPITPLWIDPNR